MRKSLSIACLAACLLPLAAVPQDVDRDRYAREYIQFLVVQLDEWTKGFPRDYNMAVLRPPVDSSKLSEAAKAGAVELRDTVIFLSSFTQSRDLMTNAAFRAEIAKALGVAKDVNAAMGSQRFPAPLQADWDQIRGALNNLARIYKLESLAVLDAPGGGGGGRGGRGAAAATAPPPPGAIVGFIVDKQCAVRGKGMWTNAECIARCIRDGDKPVLVTEEGKVFQIANPDKIEPDSYGQKVTITGKTAGETITIESLK